MTELAIALVATVAIQALTSVTVFTAAILAPIASQDIGVAASAIGVFTSIIYGVASISAPVGGALVARVGAVRVSQGCLLFAGCGLAICGLAHPLIVVFGAVVIGMGYGPPAPAGSTLLIERSSDRVRNVIMSIRQTGVPLGGAFAGLVVPSIVIAVGWRAAALIMGGLCLLLAMILQPMRAAYDGHARRSNASRPPPASLLRMVWTHEELRRLSFASFAYAGMQVCFSSYLVVFLTEKGGLRVLNAGAALSAAMVAGIVGRLLWGLVADVFGNARRLLAVLGVMMALCAASMALVTPAWPFSLVLLLCVVFGAIAMGWNGVFIAEIARIAPDGKVAVATGATLAVTYFGVMIGPFFFWFILKATGSYAAAFGSAAIVTLAASALIVRRTPAAAGSSLPKGLTSGNDEGY